MSNWKPSEKDINDAVRAAAHYDSRKMSFHNWRTLIAAAAECLENRKDAEVLRSFGMVLEGDGCPICGEDHESTVPLPCETGDGV